MTKTYIRGFCWLCGELISSAGFASYHHNLRHVREGLLIERSNQRTRKRRPESVFEFVKNKMLVQNFFFIQIDFDKMNKKHLDVYNETGRFVGAYKTLEDVRQRFSPHGSIRRGPPLWWRHRRWKDHIGPPPKLGTLNEQGIDYWFRQYLVLEKSHEVE